jgi:hypothetical protein
VIRSVITTRAALSTLSAAARSAKGTMDSAAAVTGGSRVCVINSASSEFFSRALAFRNK